MKKKVLAVILTTAITASVLAGCGSSNNQKATTSTSETTENVQTTETAEANTEESVNIQTALDVINSFASGDTSVAENNLKEDYIQHNLAYGTGRDAFIGSVEYLAWV